MPKLSGLSLVWRVVIFIVLVVLALFVLSRLGFKFDPFNLSGRRLDAAVAEAETATSQSDAYELQAGGEVASAQRVDAFTHLTIDIQRAGAAADAESRSAPDANTPYPVDRADRLRGVDRELCEASPRTCQAAAPDDARGGDTALSADAGAGSPDAG
jgi:hypothetical protein